jgi:hypothetical protein
MGYCVFYVDMVCFIERPDKERLLMTIIGEEAKKILESSLGLPFNQLSDLSIHEEICLVKAKTGNNLRFTKNKDFRKTGRGSPLLARNKITTIEEINNKIDAL